MKFCCCGVAYSTGDPETFWCIETYIMKKPEKIVFDGKKIFKEIVYTLFCKKNGCSKLEIHRFVEEDEELCLVEKERLKGQKARAYLERTKNMRIKIPQCCPLKSVTHSKNIPWVYGKAIDGERQVPRFFDESGNRDVFKKGGWEKDVIYANLKTYKI